MIYNFKSIPEFYEKEKSGLKPNTVRVIGDNDSRRNIKAGDLVRIRNSSDENDYIEREVIDVSSAGKILGKSIVIISFKEELK